MHGMKLPMEEAAAPLAPGTNAIRREPGVLVLHLKETPWYFSRRMPSDRREKAKGILFLKYFTFSI